MFTRELFALPVGSPENIKAKKRAKRRVSKKGKKKRPISRILAPWDAAPDGSSGAWSPPDIAKCKLLP